jgi:hypothetical protein
MQIHCSKPREQRIRVLYPSFLEECTLRYALSSGSGATWHQIQLPRGSTHAECVVKIPPGRRPTAYAAWIEAECGLYSYGAWEPNDGVLIWSLQRGLEIPIRAKGGRVIQKMEPPDLLWVRIPEFKLEYGVPPLSKSDGKFAFLGIPPGSEVSYGWFAEKNYRPMESLLGGVEID